MLRMPLISVLLVSACAPAISPEEQRQNLISRDQAKCSSFGFQPATNEFANCMLELDRQRQEINRTALAGYWATR